MKWHSSDEGPSKTVVRSQSPVVFMDNDKLSRPQLLKALDGWEGRWGAGGGGGYVWGWGLHLIDGQGH